MAACPSASDRFRSKSNLYSQSSIETLPSSSFVDDRERSKLDELMKLEKKGIEPHIVHITHSETFRGALVDRTDSLNWVRSHSSARGRADPESPIYIVESYTRFAQKKRSIFHQSISSSDRLTAAAFNISRIILDEICSSDIVVVSLDEQRGE